MVDASRQAGGAARRRPTEQCALWLVPQETAEAGMQRLVRQSLEKTHGLLQKAKAGGPEADRPIHDARKEFKRLRAMLRLVRTGSDAAFVTGANVMLRDCGRALAGARDAQVYLETLDKLAASRRGVAAQPAPVSLRRSLARHVNRLKKQTLPAGALDAVMAQVTEAQKQVESWVAGDDRQLIGDLRRTYAKARELYRAALETGDTHTLHEWRKQVKYLWHQHECVQAAWPGVIHAQIAELRLLARRLGDDHDLAIFAELLDAHPEMGTAAERESLLRLVARRRKRLMRDALLLGARLFAEKSRAMEDRLGAWLRAWRG